MGGHSITDLTFPPLRLAELAIKREGRWRSACLPLLHYLNPNSRGCWLHMVDGWGKGAARVGGGGAATPLLLVPRTFVPIKVHH